MAIRDSSVYLYVFDESFSFRYGWPMELRQLASLEAVLHTGSFAAAARARHLAQPALWMQVKALERELEVRLFERAGRGVRPTTAAVALRDRVQRVLDDVRLLAGAASEVRAGRAIPAVLGCAPYSVPHYVTPCIARLRRERPELPLPSVIPISSATGPGALVGGELDLVILPGRGERGLPGAPLYPVWISVLGRGVGRGVVDLAALDGRPIATLPSDTGVGALLREACREAGVRPRIVLESRDVGSLRAWARAGLALVVVVSDGLGPALAARTARLAWRGQVFQADLWLRWRSEEALTSPAKALRATLLDEARARRPTARTRTYWPGVEATPIAVDHPRRSAARPANVRGRSTSRIR
jgi:DNA-binding transcriptional LysR family regulator